MRGLDPRIHTALPRLRGFSMDRRVKPGGDEDGRNGSVPRPDDGLGIPAESLIRAAGEG